LLVLGCRGSLDKMAGSLDDARFRARLAALRVAVIFHHARRPIDPPRVDLKVGAKIRLTVPARWLAAHPQTAYLLAKERDEWKALGYAFNLAQGKRVARARRR
jgi:exopolyphosphatase/guanosine-5'-triphosphate,3'-diphosphate pyrophosphatase